MSRPFLLGVLGGMGPLATVDFMATLLAATPADSDQQQIPVLAWNVPQIPDRQKALAGCGPDPLPQLLRGIEILNQAGASHIVIPCNTAHHWHDQLSAASRAPVLHMVQETLDDIASLYPRPARVGVIGTPGTLRAGWYQNGLEQRAMTPLTPTARELEQAFVPGCYAVKRGDIETGGAAFARLGQTLLERGAQRLILACSEIPLALRAVQAPFLALTIDPAQALARRCSAIWQQYRHTQYA
ncbi:aspartate/glutamate racemase family protein [Entomohabitans teleogrylli]|uniref:aspartate/glutamate racemase family protein n=1 Tax=Entomohabitans teleogrylli TaxID=1384589 RepID=UPI00073D70C2|nr:amino acid racemase [Entomohabitans teleogrylli]